MLKQLKRNNYASEIEVAAIWILEFFSKSSSPEQAMITQQTKTEMIHILDMAESSYMLRSALAKRICSQKFTLPILKDLKDVLSMQTPSVCLLLLRAIAESDITTKTNYTYSLLEKMVTLDLDQVAIRYEKRKMRKFSFIEHSDFIEDCYILEAESEALISLKEIAS